MTHKLLLYLSSFFLGALAYGEEVASVDHSSNDFVLVDKIEDAKNDGRKYYAIDKINVPLPKLRFDEDSGLYLIEFSKDRVATIGIYDEIKKFRAPGKLIENSCNRQFKNISCDLYIEYIVKVHRIIWYRHPDTNKIGKVLKAYTQSISTENGKEVEKEYPSALLVNTFRYTPVSRFSSQTDKHRFKDEELVKLNDSYLKCESTKWFEDLANSQNKSSGKIQVREWATEIMMTNPETKVSENRTYMSAYNIDLSMRQGKIAIDAIDMYPVVSNSSVLFYGNNIFLGEVLGWNMAINKRRCDLSFNMTSVEILGYVAQLDEYINQKKMRPLKFSSLGKAQDLISKLKPIDRPNSQRLEYPRFLQEYLNFGFISYLGSETYSVGSSPEQADGEDPQKRILRVYLKGVKQ